jgi:Tfp pilus assembly protein PilF
LFELALESQRDGDYRAAVGHYRQAITQSKDRIPACHNNLGVILAMSGMLEEATREFETAVKQSRGKSAEASQNLTRCQQIIGGGPSGMIAALKITEVAPGLGVKAED